MTDGNVLFRNLNIGVSVAATFGVEDQGVTHDIRFRVVSSLLYFHQTSIAAATPVLGNRFRNDLSRCVGGTVNEFCPGILMLSRRGKRDR